MQSLFDLEQEETKPSSHSFESAPLADRMRPTTLDEYFGQSHLVGDGKILKRMIDRDDIPSMIFWGPPGVGKTTLAQIIAEQTNAQFINFSAVISGIKEIREVMKRAEINKEKGLRTIVFVDEIHRFNKAQQDAFLPYVERGAIILIGATTENPSFEINNALLSRCKVFVLKALGEDDLFNLLKRSITDINGFADWDVEISDEQLRLVAQYANGDARMALNTIEMILFNSETEIRHAVVTDEILKQSLTNRTYIYDKHGEEHYNMISAMHKSIRNSDADAAIYWMARMLEGGEDPLYIARRIVRCASEDIGMADSRCLEIALQAYQACQYLGYPECNVHLTHAIVFLSLAPKSNALELAYDKAAADAIKTMDEGVPLHIRNAPTKLMAELGYHQNYEYAHDLKEKMSPMVCLPESLRYQKYYVPTDQGLERRIGEHKASIDQWKEQERKKRGI